MRAKILYENGCYSEAYAIVEPLAEKYPADTQLANFKKQIEEVLMIK